MNILITGAAGYVGGMVTDQFKEGPGVQILALDKEGVGTVDTATPCVTWLAADLSKTDWSTILGPVKPDVVIHTAWNESKNAIMRGEKSYNELMATNIFEYCSRHQIKKLIYLSAIDAYGTGTENHGRIYIENDALRESESSYGADVVRVESALKRLFGGSSKRTQLYILRLPIVYGPYAKKRHCAFGILRMFEGVMPLTVHKPDDIPFQIIHEDDVVDILGLITFNTLRDSYEVFNCAPDSLVSASFIASHFGKKLLPVSKTIMRILPASPARLIYPIIADGTKLAKKFNYQYNYKSHEAIIATEGRYAKGQN